jgi:DNA-binding transcriptional MocR family regulator
VTDHRLVEDRLDRGAVVGGAARHPANPGPWLFRWRHCYSTDIDSALRQYLIGGNGARGIASGIEAAIDAGALRPGDPLPAVRRLATDLGVSPATVAAALADLRARGLVVTRERSRSHVGWRPPVAGAWLGAPLPAGVRDLAGGNPDPELLPDRVPFLRRLEPGRRLYGEDHDDQALLEPARAELRADGIETGHLAVAGGALDGIERALQARLRPGDGVAVEDPGFAGLFDLLRALGLALHPVGIDARGMDPEGLAAALADGAAAMIVNPRGQNPTGAALDPGRAAELRAVLDRAPDVLVLEDDHLGPIAGAPRLTLTAGRRRWAVARSVAKSLDPDLRLAVLSGDERTMSRVRGRQAVGPQWVSGLLQGLAAAMWADPGVATTLERAAEAYRERREALLAALAEQRIQARAGGISAWVPVPEEAAVVQSLRERGWAVAPGAPYRLRSPRAIRITTSTLTAAESEQLAADLAAALRPQASRPA